MLLLSTVITVYVRLILTLTILFYYILQMFYYSLYVLFCEKKEEILLSHMTKASAATEKSRKQGDNTNTLPNT